MIFLENPLQTAAITNVPNDFCEKKFFIYCSRLVLCVLNVITADVCHNGRCYFYWATIQRRGDTGDTAGDTGGVAGGARLIKYFKLKYFTLDLIKAGLFTSSVNTTLLNFFLFHFVFHFFYHCATVG